MGFFDFLLGARFTIEKDKFPGFVYEDEYKDDFLSRYGRQVTAYERRLSSDQRDVAREFFSGKPSQRRVGLPAHATKLAGDEGTLFSANGDSLTARQVAELLNLHIVTVYKLASSGRLPSFKIGYSLRFRPEQIEAFISRGGSRGPV
jgi:excisionase family DNA binding protein